MRKSKDRKSRRIVLEKLRRFDLAEQATWEVLCFLEGGEDKEKLGYWRKGFKFAMDKLKEIA